MSITDELREYAAHCAGGMGGDALRHIADRIDAEHQKSMDEWKARNGQMWLKGYSECRAEIAEGNDAIAFDLEGCGLIRLPVDADGEYIRIGDVLDGYCKTIEVVEMRYGRGGWVLISRDGNAYADSSAFKHHHEPTVEDVLREFTEKIIDSQIPNMKPTYEEAIAEYAAKLRLAGDAE